MPLRVNAFYGQRRTDTRIRELDFARGGGSCQAASLRAFHLAMMGPNEGSLSDL